MTNFNVSFIDEVDDIEFGDDFDLYPECLDDEWHELMHDDLVYGVQRDNTSEISSVTFNGKPLDVEEWN